MTPPRKQFVAVEDIPYYPVVSAVYVAVTCVVSMLIPVKTMTVFAPAKQSYTGTPDRSIPVNNHRLRWIENRIRILWSLFAIEICSYSVMSNPIHLVVKLMPQEAQSWTEVLDNDFHVCLTELPFLNDMIYTYNQTKTTSS